MENSNQKTRLVTPRVGHVALMFSGGVDSTVAALNLANVYERVHLLTFCNGYGHYAFHRTHRRVRELQARRPGKFVHYFSSIRILFERLCISSLDRDFRRFGSGFIWCMGCKIAMHTRSVLYCCQNRIGYMSDGSAADSSEMVEQSLVSLSFIKWFYDEFGIEFVVPVYNISREEKIEFLRRNRFYMGLPIGQRAIGIQPSCIPGLLYYMPYLLVGQAPKHQESVVAAYIAEKLDLARSWLAQKLGNVHCNHSLDSSGQNGGLR